MSWDKFNNVQQVINHANDRFMMRPFVSQGDWDGRTLTVQVTDDGVVKKQLGLNLNLKWQNKTAYNQGMTPFKCIDVNQSIFLLTYPNNMMTAGKVDAQIQVLYDGQSTILKTFEIVVQGDVNNPKAYITESSFGVLEKALSDVNKIDSNFANLDQKKADKDAVWGMANLDQEVKDKMTGGSVAVVGDDSIAYRNLKQKAVSYENTNFVDTGKQIFNKLNIADGIKIDPSNGKALLDTTYITTSFIPVFGSEEAFTLIGKGIGCVFAHFNEKLEYISGGTFNNTDIQQIYSKPKAKYLQFSIKKSNLDALMIARGFLSALDYEKYYEKLVNEDGRVSEIKETLETFVLPEGQYASETLYATIANSIGVAYTNDYVKIKVSFGIGEAKNDRCIVIKDDKGNAFVSQFEPDINANYKKQSIDGYYKDKSLKNGNLWIKDSLGANVTKNYTIEIYPVEVVVPKQPLTVEKTDSSLRINANVTYCDLKKASKYLIDFVRVSGINRTLTNNSSLSYDGATINFRYNADVKLDKVTYDKEGHHYIDVNLKYIYKNELSIYIRYRFLSNGNIEMRQYADIVKATSTSKINQIVQRYLIDTKTYTIDTKDLYSCSWSDDNLKAITILQSQGDAPRGSNSDSVPNLPAYSNLVDRGENHEIMSGWSTTNKTINIPKECGFLSTIFFNFAGFDDTAQDNNNRVLNQLVGYATKKTTEENKGRIIKNIERYTIHMMKETKKDTSNSPFSAYTDGKFLLMELGKGGDLDQISQEYKDSMQKTYGTITPDSLWALRNGGGVSLDVAGRLFPTAKIFKNKYEKLGNDDEAAYYTNILTSYAEMLCKSVEKSGWVGILVDVLNSNGCACGSRGLMMGLEIEPDNTRWQNALVTNDEVFKSFIRCKNAVVDGQDQDLTNYHYLQYHLFSTYEHTFIRDEYFFDVAEYSAVASNARGQLLDQEYCISSSRRGSPVGNAYVAYLMIKRGNCSDYETANVMLNALADKMLPTGGAPRILDDWFNPSTSYVNTIAITTSVLLQLYYQLQD